MLASSFLLSYPLLLVSSLVSSSIPSRGHSRSVLDDSDDTNTLPGVVVDELM